MTGSSFQRARSEEQRQQRREKIVEVTAAMLREMPVADISLNELSRRVGLAKSNVLRYFESREAILLHLLETELQSWARAAEASIHPGPGDLPQRITQVAEALATSLTPRATLCDLISAQTAVLERNISTEVALKHKQDVGMHVNVVIAALRTALPEITQEQGMSIMTHFIVATSGAWPQTHPSEAVRSVYATHPEIAEGQMDFEQFLRDTVQDSILGALLRGGTVNVTTS